MPENPKEVQKIYYRYRLANGKQLTLEVIEGTELGKEPARCEEKL